MNPQLNPHVKVEGPSFPTKGQPDEASESCSFSFSRKLVSHHVCCELFPCVECFEDANLYITAVIMCAKKGLGWMVDLVCYNVLSLLFTELQ